jgi:hypothetical protein
MSSKAGKIAAGTAGILALGTAGYFANEWRVCRELEQGVLDTAYSIRSGARMEDRLAAIGSTGTSPELQKARDLQLDVFQRHLAYVYDRCGLEAGKETNLKVEDILYAP